MSNNKLLNYQSINTDKYEFLEPVKANNCYLSTCIYNLDGTNRLPYYFQTPKLYTTTGIYKIRNDYKMDLVIPVDDPFLAYLINEDDKNIQVTSDNSEEWFDEHFTTQEVSDKYKTSLIFRQGGEDPILRVNISSYRNKPRCEVFDVKGKECDYSFIQPESYIVGILEKVGINFYKDILTGGYELHKVKVYNHLEQSKLPKGYIFDDDNVNDDDENLEDDSDDDDDDENLEDDSDDDDDDENLEDDSDDDDDDENLEDDSDDDDDDENPEDDTLNGEFEELNDDTLNGEFEELNDDTLNGEFEELNDDTLNDEFEELNDDTEEFEELDDENLDDNNEEIEELGDDTLNDDFEELDDDFEELNLEDNNYENEDNEDVEGDEGDEQIEQYFEGGHEEELNENNDNLQIDELTDDELDLNLSGNDSDEFDEENEENNYESEFNPNQSELDELDLSDLEDANLEENNNYNSNVLEAEELTDDELEF